MEFQVEETLTWKDWDAWCKTYTLHGRVLGRAAKAAVGFQRGVGGLWMALGAFLLLMGLLGGILNLFTVLGAVFLAVGLRDVRKKDVRQGLSNWRAEKGLQSAIPDQPIRLTFDDGGILVWEPGGGSSFRYSALTAVWEDTERYYLFLQEKMQFILQKRAFVRGDAEAFRAFIVQKTENPVEFVK